MYPTFDTQICKIELEVNGIPRTSTLTLSIEVPEDCDTCDGATYLGNRASPGGVHCGRLGMEQITNFDLWVVARRW